MTKPRESDVNVGGPDGPRANDPPPLTVGTLTVPYDGDDSRRWLWYRLEELRCLYELRFGAEATLRHPIESPFGRFG